MTLRPNPLTNGPSRAPARAMLKAVGFTDADLKKPLIGVANTWIEIGPCNYHLRELAVHEVPCARALAHLSEFASSLRTLGSYTSWKTRESRQPDPFEVVS